MAMHGIIPTTIQRKAGAMLQASPGVALGERTTKMRQEFTPKTCVVCGALFSRRANEQATYFKRRQTCGGACGRVLTGRSKFAARQALTCDQCGNSFTTNLHQLKEGRRFCSRRCYEQFCQGKTKCGHCGVRFDSTTSGHEWFCSDACERALNPARPLGEYECAVCGTPFIGRTQDRANGQALYCSEKCMGTATVRKLRARSGTSIEQALNNELERIGVRFHEQHRLGRWKVDAFLPDSNTVIEVNGDFFHANPELYPDRTSLHPLQLQSIQRDERCAAWLAERGYRLIVLWESDIESVGMSALLSRHLWRERSG